MKQSVPQIFQERNATTDQRTEGVYGPGTYTDTNFIPVPQDSARIFRELITKTPGFTKDEKLLSSVNFVGNDLPLLPGPIKSQALTAALHAMAGVIGHEILQLRGIQTSGATTINVDHAGMYLATPALVHVDGESGPSLLENPQLPSFDRGAYIAPIKMRSQAIYPCKDGAWFQLHGSTFPDPVLEAIGVDPNAEFPTRDAAYEHIKDRIQNNFTSRELEMIMVERGLCGGIVHSPQSWLETRMGQILASHPLVNYKQVSLSADTQPPVPFPTLLQTGGDARPLAGIKILELARIIAAPAAGGILASMGADVVRVQSRELVDFTPAQMCGLMAGKRAIHLDLDEEGDREKLRTLIADADVIIQGYRLRSLERRGFGQTLALELAAARKRGVIFLDENCFGPDGYYAERPGFQQVANAESGCSWVMASADVYGGFDEGTGVLPSLPISDMATGIVSAIAILSMLRDRAKVGGSWAGCASLTAFQVTSLEPWVGLYQRDVVERIEQTFKYGRITPDLFVVELYYRIVAAWDRYAEKNEGGLTKEEDFYVHFANSIYGNDLRILAPVAKYTKDPASQFHCNGPPVPFCFHEAVAFL
ncbi:alpha methylacyl- racemase [Trichoderma arundinaceum]|uniref:Alpha methylacyl-racemase n=1 Tax=Trichoderma arundinaceum TaxID=490622 RepID=A0A395NJB5_TRIAR|nr:alpha methylacyl- racemase [Trichoderma arundinaceum]